MIRILIGLIAAVVVAAAGLLGFNLYVQHRMTSGIEAAFARKRKLPALPDAEIPTYQAYGNTVALSDADIAKMPEGNRKRALTFRRIAQVAERA